MKAHGSRAKKPLHNSKPFCECKRCVNKNCPNVLKSLGVTLKDKASEKIIVVAPKEKSCKEPELTEHKPSLLGILNPERTCNCEVVAKALKNDVHMNIGTLLKRNCFSEDATYSKQSDNPDSK